QRVNEIVRGKRGITPDTAWKLAQAFETTPAFWVNLQTNHDLARNRPTDKSSARVKSLLQRAS
ncbi:MAG: HigA family addiction module antitoxin, partial [Thermoanaerobaculia bacterium]